MSDGKIKVLHVLHSLNSGGMEGRIARLARGLDPERFSISILTLRQPTARQVDLPPHVSHELREAPRGLNLPWIFSLGLFLRERRYDILHTHNWSSMLFGLVGGWLARVPVLLHGEHGVDKVDEVPIKRLMAQRLLARIPIRVVTVNASIGRHVRANWGVPEGKIVVIPNGVDLQRFRPSPDGPPAIFTVGTVSRHDPVKNYPLLVDAFKLFLDRIAPAKARLVLVGQGSMTEELKALCVAAGVDDSVDFPGDTNRPEEWYPRFSCYVNCSIYEGMSNTVLEAMACGLPAVVSDVQGHRDWIHEGGNALYFKSGDAEALADCLSALHRDEAARRAMGNRNRARVEAEFNNGDFITRYSALYLECLGR